MEVTIVTFYMSDIKAKVFEQWYDCTLRMEYGPTLTRYLNPKSSQQRRWYFECGHLELMEAQIVIDFLKVLPFKKPRELLRNWRG